MLEKLKMLRENLDAIEVHGQANLNRLLGCIQYLTRKISELEAQNVPADESES